jgi:hypothetical protein
VWQLDYYAELAVAHSRAKITHVTKTVDSKPLCLCAQGEKVSISPRELDPWRDPPNIVQGAQGCVR